MAEPAGAAARLIGSAGDFLDEGGIAIWAIAALSVVTLAIILWKLWHYSPAGGWRRARAEAAVVAWRNRRDYDALSIAGSGRGGARGWRSPHSVAPAHPAEPTRRPARRPPATPVRC